MEESQQKNNFISKIFNTGNFVPNSVKLSPVNHFVFWIIVVLSVIIKIYLIPYNMMDSGDNATRVWNALWWADNPFLVLPESGHPLWFYFMGPLIKITGEIYYTPVISMIVLMTVAGLYIFRSALLFTNFRISVLAFIIFTINPVIFRLNFQPYAQQLALAAICIMAYFILKALISEKSRINFIVAGIFAFIALASRPEVLFVMIALAFFVLLSKKPGAVYFAVLSLIFQVFWIAVSYAVYGSLFKTFETDALYSVPVDIHGSAIGLRLKGLFLPFYFLVFGLTLILFYCFIRGIIYSFKNYPRQISVFLLLLIFVPVLVNGIISLKSTLYHTTNYIYLSFFIAPVFCAVGLNYDIDKIKRLPLKISFAAFVIISCIPLSYIKDFVPEKYNSLFPKVIQFFVTADEPEETWKLVKFIDENIDEYPALVFDSEENSSSIFYIPFRTKLAPPDKVLISGYNVPSDSAGLRTEIDKFIKKNRKGIIMFRNSPTLMNRIFGGLLNNKPYKRNDISLEVKTDKWNVYVYGQNY